MFHLDHFIIHHIIQVNKINKLIEDNLMKINLTIMLVIIIIHQIQYIELIHAQVL
jgi:hypothetical protein